MIYFKYPDGDEVNICFVWKLAETPKKGMTPIYRAVKLTPEEAKKELRKWKRKFPKAKYSVERKLEVVFKDDQSYYREHLKRALRF